MDSVSTTASRRCARAGCRAWAVRGRRLCSSHLRQEQFTLPDDTSLSDARHERNAAFAELVRDGRLGDALEEALHRAMAEAGQALTLGTEIGALRLQLQRVIAIDGLDGDTHDTAATVARLTDAIVRAVRMQRTLSGDLADDISAALTRILTELGLGDEP